MSAIPTELARRLGVRAMHAPGPRDRRLPLGFSLMWLIPVSVLAWFGIISAARALVAAFLDLP